MANTLLTPTLVIGAGAWGTALAMAVARNGHEVLLWGRDPAYLAEMESTRQNSRYLPALLSRWLKQNIF